LLLVSRFLLIASGFWLLECAGRTGTGMEPFSRTVLLFFDAHEGNKRVSDALLSLELETGKPRSITVRAFDEHDRPIRIDPDLVTWSGSDNLVIAPSRRVASSGSATVKVTLIGSGEGFLRVTILNHSGEIKVRRRE
jgi:hypothetical protein